MHYFAGHFSLQREYYYESSIEGLPPDVDAYYWRVFEVFSEFLLANQFQEVRMVFREINLL